LPLSSKDDIFSNLLSSIMPTARRISLIGYRACGKTTVGKALAKRLNWAYVDADEYLERKAKRKIPDIFSREGETAFRELESECLAEILADNREMVLSTGGGCVLNAANRALLRSNGVVVYLQAPAELLQQRLRASLGDRPSLTGASAIDEVPSVLSQREPWYHETAAHVLKADQPVAALVDSLIGLALK
jgi:shikimate kinase